jgi:hypothetical protein
MNVKKMRLESMGWILLAHGRVKCASCCEHSDKPLGFIKCVRIAQIAEDLIVLQEEDYFVE